MTSFKSLEKILEMDFTKMRSLEGPGGMRAEPETILEFSTQLNIFFDQFKDSGPTPLELSKYKELIILITEEINKAEVNYSLNRYKKTHPKDYEAMAASNKLASFKMIPTRMQYWAAGEGHGDCIRNVTAHKEAVKRLTQWASLIDTPNPAYFHRFFSSSGSTAVEREDKSEPLAKRLRFGEAAE